MGVVGGSFRFLVELRGDVLGVFDSRVSRVESVGSFLRALRRGGETRLGGEGDFSFLTSSTGDSDCRSLVEDDGKKLLIGVNVTGRDAACSLRGVKSEV